MMQMPATITPEPVALVDCTVCLGTGIMAAHEPGRPDLTSRLVVVCPACEGGCSFQPINPYINPAPGCAGDL